ncbi:odorant receptor 13a-like [Vespula squamosa]|uniref:Odorant receptor 13a-like n=1 Tax=Vespula squamosa TaxID=30214 RepID=A0ABD2B3U4_VESSQ
MANFSIEYKLPYKIKPLLKPYDEKSYAFGCIYQFFGKTVLLSGYVGTDCLLACTDFHLTGQLAILNCRVKKFLKNNHDTQGRIRQMILRHYRLIILADILEDSFNIVIFLHMVGSMNLLCTSSYQMLFVRILLTELERVYRFTFLIYVCLLSYTFTNLCDAIYHYNWYELSMINLKFLCICMVRARKPLQLTCAKFCVVSLCTFTKASYQHRYELQEKT